MPTGIYRLFRYGCHRNKQGLDGSHNWLIKFGIHGKFELGIAIRIPGRSTFVFNPWIRIVIPEEPPNES